MMMANAASPVTDTEGEFTFKLEVSADIAPSFQVVAYAILPSQGVIAHSADFDTEKCFSHSVSASLITVTPRRGPAGNRLCSRLCVPGVSGVLQQLGCPGGADLHAA